MRKFKVTRHSREVDQPYKPPKVYPSVNTALFMSLPPDNAWSILSKGAMSAIFCINVSR